MHKKQEALHCPDTASWASPAGRPMPLFPNQQGTRTARQGVWFILKSCLAHSDLDPSINLQMLRNIHFRLDPCN